MKQWIAVLMMVAIMSVTAFGNWNLGVLTDAKTSKVEGRVGIDIDDQWEVGVLAVWFAEDPDTDWGGGGYFKLAVDPNGSVPVANWLPGLGDLLNLPDSMPAQTYVIGKLLCIPYDDGPDLMGSVGAGAQIGPAFLEWIYNVVEGGESDNPILSSGAELWIGLCLEF